ncbi:MAG: hypothetical protein IT546_09045 [Caulobacteraceae bacterium]|nr:hypothetical protein [Caulobacteraceae bacterium]
MQSYIFVTLSFAVAATPLAPVDRKACGLRLKKSKVYPGVDRPEGSGLYWPEVLGV